MANKAKELRIGVMGGKQRNGRRTLLCPQMLPIHFELLKTVFESSGYKLSIIDVPKHDALEYGLRYANNDLCYPAIMITGQIVAALKTGNYDLESVSVLMVQTGGSCRATNYIPTIKKALLDSGLPDVPVVSLSLNNFGEKYNLRLTGKMIYQAVYAIALGDLLMKCLYRVRPYEKSRGSADKLCERWTSKCRIALRSISPWKFAAMCKNIVEDYENLATNSKERYPRIGVVGEIMVKYHPEANDHIVDYLENEGCEVVVAGLSEFFLYCASNPIWQERYLGKSRYASLKAKISISLLTYMLKPMNSALRKSTRFEPMPSIFELAKLANPLVSLCNNAGEGWYLVADTRYLITGDVKNIVCIQPFGCLPNHVLGRGAISAIKRIHLDANIVALDYDPGISEVNRLNRLKLFLSTAFSPT